MAIIVSGELRLVLFCAALLFISLPPPCAATSAALVGINYGRVGNNLPPPSAVPPLLASLGIGRVRLYDADPNVLRAFAGTGVELVVGLPDRCVLAVADPGEALSWVQANVQPFLPATKIAALTVGNEVLTGANASTLSHSLLPAMQSLHAALVQLGLDRDIVVTTAHNLGILAASYPPSSAYFRRDLLPYICPILDFHAKTGSPFLVNAYPYFAYADDPSGIDLEYALGDPGYAGVSDAGTGLHYPNLLTAQVDAVYHAIAAVGGPSATAVEVRVSETGWPSGGDSNETFATLQNAATYNTNVMRQVAECKGTPLRPAAPLRAYVFAMFNENMKPGPGSERNYGLFRPDGTPVYNLGFSLPVENSTAGYGSGNFSNGYGYGRGNGGGNFFNGTNGSMNGGGYYDISAAVPKGGHRRQTHVLMLLVVAAVLVMHGAQF